MNALNLEDYFIRKAPPEAMQAGPVSRRSESKNRSGSKGSRRNKFTILGVEAPVGQGAKTQEYRDIPSFRNAARRDASTHKM